jgi:alpha-tubulin suppressor-like RCC1 family protein
MSRLPAIALALAAACGNSLFDHLGVDMHTQTPDGGGCPVESTAACGSQCLPCNQLPNSTNAACVDHACTYDCTAPYLKFADGCRLATAVAAGGDTTCAIVEGGEVSCWGRNDHRQLGPNASGPFSRTPVGVPGLTGVSGLAVGSAHVCAIAPNGVYCWGGNASGQLGGDPGADNPTPTLAPQVSGALSLSAGEAHTCARTASDVRCWGKNDLGQLGRSEPAQSGTPLLVEGLASVSELSSRLDHSCAVETGAVKCWGANGFGQLGSGSTSTFESEPKQALSSGATHVAAGERHSCAMQSGTMECWGDGASGQLGDGNHTGSASPVRPNSISNPAGLAAGGAHTCAFFSGGGGQSNLRCWGANGAGQLGLGNTLEQDEPAIVPLAGVQALAAGTSHTCALLAGGELRCWGANDQGQTGSASPDAQILSPAVVSGR